MNYKCGHPRTEENSYRWPEHPFCKLCELARKAAKSEDTTPIPVSMSQVRFAVHLCMMRGLSPEVSCELVKRILGYEVCEESVRRWRASGYCDSAILELTIR